MDREVLRQKLVDSLSDLAGRWVVPAEGKRLARAGVAYWRTAGAAEVDRFAECLNLVGEDGDMTAHKMTEAQAKSLAAALGVDTAAPNWLAILGAAIKALQWVMDLLNKQPTQATAQAAGAKHGYEDCCCACLEAAHLAVESAQTSLTCACACCATP